MMYDDDDPPLHYWLGGLRSPASLSLSLRPIGLAALALATHPSNWIQTNLETQQWTRPAGLIELYTNLNFSIAMNE